MENIFINCSNHPSINWSEPQIEAALKYGKIVDIQFPNVDCDLTNKEIDDLAESYAKRIMEYNPAAVMCMGEFVTCYKIVEILKKNNIKVLASCTKRETEEAIQDDGSIIKNARFVFAGFREF